MRVLLLCMLVSLVCGYNPSRGTNNNPCGGGCGGQAAQQSLVKPQSCGGVGCGGCSSQGCVQPPKSVSGQYWWQGNNSPFAQGGCGGGGGGCGGTAPAAVPFNPCGGGGGGGCGSQQPFTQNNPLPQQQFTQNNPSPRPQQQFQQQQQFTQNNPRPQQQFTQNNPRPQQQFPQLQQQFPHNNPSPQQQFPRPQQQFQQQQVLPPQSNAVMPPMGICPASFVCVHWQLCRDGFLITDGTGKINKQIKSIPQQVQSTSQSCGGDMICCGVPTINAPPIPNQPSIPFQRPNPQPQQQPQTLPPRVITPRPTQRPIPRPTPAPTRRPAPAPQPQQGYNNQPPPQPFRPRPQPTNNPPQAQPTNNNPVRPVANPPGLSGPPSRPAMMNNMMMMMMGPMRSPGTCSAGLYCVERRECNPYNGFIINDPNQLVAVFPGADTVPLTPCVVQNGNIQDGVCCQQVHPNPQGFD